MTQYSPPGMRLACLLALALAGQFSPLATARADLTLAAAEQLALSADPAVIARESRALALQEQAIADGQLPDPKLLLGVSNLPLDDFSLKKEPMSQVVAGLRQAFPRGDTLKYRREYTEWMGRAESAGVRRVRAEILRDVRQTYLELYYQEQAARIVAQNRNLFEQLVDITRAHYASGRVSQQDVLQAQLELSRLDDRATRIDAQRDIQRAALARWIGAAAGETLDGEFPPLPALPALSVLEAGLAQHPAIRSASARVQAGQRQVMEAREQYKPGFDVGVEYRKRFGNNADGSDRPDMMAALLTLDLPVFSDKRQDKHLSASRLQTEVAVQLREQALRELQRTLAGDYARWQRLGEQQRLYRDHLLREAADNAEAAVHAYQSGTTEFTALVRARIGELDIRLQAIRIRVDRAAAHARLLYLLPDAENTASSAMGEQP